MINIGIFSGGFKPFTTGHFSKLSLSMKENDLTVLFYGISERKKGSDFVFTKQMSEDIFSIVSRAIKREFSNVIVEKGIPSPTSKTFELIKSVADNDQTSLQNFGIFDKVNNVTVYSDPVDSQIYLKFVGSKKEKQYFGNLIDEKRLKFDSGLSENNSMHRIISSMRMFYEKESEKELLDKSLLRGSDFRRIVLEKNKKKLYSYLPPFLNEAEKDEIIEILFKGILVESFVKIMLSEALEAHILNFYEDFNMPLSEIFELAELISEGRLENIEEKMDGQNISFTVIDGEVLFFSKGASWKNVQRGGLNREAIETKYENMVSVRNAFLMAYDALQEVVDQNSIIADKLFKNGGVIAETALMTPHNPNTIVYDVPQIRFIQAVPVDPTLKTIDQNAYQDFVKRAASISRENFPKIGFVEMLRLKKNIEDKSEINSLISRFSMLISSHGLSERNTMGELITALVEKKINSLGVFKEQNIENVSKRISSGVKKYVDLKTLNPEERETLKSIEKNNLFVQSAIIPIERIIQGLGVLVFKNIDFAIASNDLSRGEELRSFVRKVKRSFEKGKIIGDKDQLNQIKVALDRIGDEKMFEKAVEGIVFRWKGKTRKLTGLFTPINKLRGIFAYSKSPPQIVEKRSRR